ncbi:hypothetical protein D3C84_1308340 [compost metagenome]
MIAVIAFFTVGVRVLLEVTDLQPCRNGGAEEIAQGVDEPVGRRRRLFDLAFVDDRFVLHERFATEV